jgi:predicted secreted protein
MKKSLENRQMLWVLVPLLVLTMVLGACTGPTTEAANPPATRATTTAPTPEVNSNMPRLDKNNINSIRIELLYDDLLAQKYITQDITMEQAASLIVILGSNLPTCFAGPMSAISNGNVLSEYSYQYVEPATAIAGSHGKNVWTFKTLQAGTSTIVLEFSPGGQLDWKVTLNVTVK